MHENQDKEFLQLVEKFGMSDIKGTLMKRSDSNVSLTLDGETGNFIVTSNHTKDSKGYAYTRVIRSSDFLRSPDLYQGANIERNVSAESLRRRGADKAFPYEASSRGSNSENLLSALGDLAPIRKKVNASERGTRRMIKKNHLNSSNDSANEVWKSDEASFSSAGNLNSSWSAGERRKRVIRSRDANVGDQQSRPRSYSTSSSPRRMRSHSASGPRKKKENDDTSSQLSMADLYGSTIPRQGSEPSVADMAHNPTVRRRGGRGRGTLTSSEHSKSEASMSDLSQKDSESGTPRSVGRPKLATKASSERRLRLPLNDSEESLESSSGRGRPPRLRRNELLYRSQRHNASWQQASSPVAGRRGMNASSTLEGKKKSLPKIDHLSLSNHSLQRSKDRSSSRNLNASFGDLKASSLHGLQDMKSHCLQRSQAGSVRNFNGPFGTLSTSSFHGLQDQKHQSLQRSQGVSARTLNALGSSMAQSGLPRSRTGSIRNLNALGNLSAGSLSHSSLHWSQAGSVRNLNASFGNLTASPGSRRAARYQIDPSNSLNASFQSSFSFADSYQSLLDDEPVEIEPQESWAGVETRMREPDQVDKILAAEMAHLRSRIENRDKEEDQLRNEIAMLRSKLEKKEKSRMGKAALNASVQKVKKLSELLGIAVDTKNQSKKVPALERNNSTPSLHLCSSPTKNHT